MKRVFVLIMFVCLNAGLFGQSLKAFIRAADQAMEKKDYYSAVNYYLNASEFDSTKIDLQFKLAESARLFNAYKLARSRYEYVMSQETESNFPLASFWLADVEQKLGDFENAKLHYEMYLAESMEGDEYYTLKAEKEIKACDWALDIINHPDLSTNIQRLGDGINSVHSEFGAIKTVRGLFYSSLKYPDPFPKEIPVKWYSKILKSEDEMLATELEQGINLPNRHVGHTSFNPTNEQMYYTICDYIDGLEIRCDIYYRIVNPDGSYGPEEKLPEWINDPGFTNSQPHITLDPASGNERLYFVSDRIGGKGKMDIWFSTKQTDGRFGKPENLEKINTPENEISPFFHRSTQSLYFSSDGFQRLGGYDIYKSEMNGNQFLDVQHLPAPFNSSYHEIYYTLSDNQETAYFSSNRPGSLYIDDSQEACCYDIYRADIEEVDLKLNVEIFDRINQKPLPGARVRLYDQKTGRMVGEKLDPTGNTYTFLLEKNRNYIVYGDKHPYERDSAVVTTKNLFTSQELNKKLFLNLEKIELEILVFDSETQEEVHGAVVELMDLSTPLGQDLSEFNESNNQFIFDLEPGHAYRISASKKDEYKTKSIILDTSVETGEGKIIRKIYLEKRDLNIYLPLTLYFDNDRPDPKYYSPKTNKTYTDTYFPYLNRKEFYKTRSANKFAGENKILRIQKMEDFFEFDVKGGYDKMKLFLSALLNELQKGQSFEIKIKGFASPISTSDYNRILGKRRVNSIHNEISKYIGGELIPFIEKGQLVITDVSYGEDLSPSYVSDLRNDMQNSVFSVEASMERRTEIIEIKNTEDK